jgi:hypothetical protein
METYKFIADEKEMKFFWDYLLPPLGQSEIWFVSLSARNKMLNEEERKFFQIGRSEMFAKQQIRHDSWKEFIKHIKRFEVNKEAFLTKSDIPYPSKVLVCYINFVAVDAYKAMKDQMSYLTEILSGLADSAMKNSQGGLNDSFYKIRKSFDTCQSLFARNFGHKEWVDIDIDVELKDEYIQGIREIILQKFSIGDFVLVRTYGGLHCLIRKSKLNFNPRGLCNLLSQYLPFAHEITINTNCMMPLPGSVMYGSHIVTILNKEDFVNVEPFSHVED